MKERREREREIWLLQVVTNVQKARQLSEEAADISRAKETEVAQAVKVAMETELILANVSNITQQALEVINHTHLDVVISYTSWKLKICSLLIDRNIDWR